jgi:hypothetical protein
MFIVLYCVILRQPIIHRQVIYFFALSNKIFIKIFCFSKISITFALSNYFKKMKTTFSILSRYLSTPGLLITFLFFDKKMTSPLAYVKNYFKHTLLQFVRARQYKQIFDTHKFSLLFLFYTKLRF